VQICKGANIYRKCRIISFLLNVRKIATYLKVAKGLYDLQTRVQHTMVQGGDNWCKVAGDCKSMKLFTSF
jgi:hypothetical protein